LDEKQIPGRLAGRGEGSAIPDRGDEVAPS